jgi:hypothetical protein
MTEMKDPFNLLKIISDISEFARSNHITREKIELYLYRTVILLITFIHLIKFLWFTLSH